MAVDVLELTFDDVIAVARQGKEVKQVDANNPRIQQSVKWVQQAMQEVEDAANEGREPVAYYGINTGFGDNAGRATFKHVAEAEHLSRKILLSHTIGVGDPFPEDVVRAALLLRIASLARGYSGVRVEVINTLIDMLNKRVFPVVPSQGSLGASGDLSPLAHMVLPISQPLPHEDLSTPGITGYCYLNSKVVSGAEAMQAAGIPQIRLAAKEGVALINGTAVSLSIGCLTYHDAEQLFAVSHLTVAMTVDAMRGFRDAFLPHINHLRNREQASCANRVLKYLKGSTLTRGDTDIDLSPEEGPPQDPYSIRCSPAVLGGAFGTLNHIRHILNEERAAVTDNPLIFSTDDPTSDKYLPRHTKVISGGNFHGAPIGYAMDFLKIVIADLASIAERRIFLLTDPKLNRGLPAFLMPEPPDQIGLNSGLMIAQYTAASLVSENKVLAHPASVDSITSSASREDHVSMSTIAARQAAQIIGNAVRVAAIELLCASQAVSLRLEQNPGSRAGRGVTRSLEFIRNLEIAPGKKLDVIREDTPLTPYVEVLVAAIQSGELVEYVDKDQ